MRKKINKMNLLGIFVLFFVIFIILTNHWASEQARIIESQTERKNVQKKTSQSYEPKKIQRQEVVRKTRLDPGREFSSSIFFMNGQEIARYKSVAENIYDYEGEIPNGKVRFVNETERTYGSEYYRNGKRHGAYKEYYKGGPIKRDARYLEGKMMTNKVYFYDGTLRMEEDFHDALWGVSGPEVGDGKIYYRDGSLMYEWHLTNADKGGYKKSYDIKGKLVEVKFFDENGELIDPKKK